MKVYRRDTIRERCPDTWPNRRSAGDVMIAVRLLVLMYVVQAGVGIVLGAAYGVWLMY